MITLTFDDATHVLQFCSQFLEHSEEAPEAVFEVLEGFRSMDEKEIITDSMEPMTDRETIAYLSDTRKLVDSLRQEGKL